MVGRLRGWLSLGWIDRSRMLWMILMGLPLMAAAVQTSGYVRTRRWLERSSTPANPRTATATDMDWARNTAQLAAIAGRHGPVTATCLRQALLVYWLLRRRGLSPELKIGVRKQGDVVEAHAWVELEGRSLDPLEVTHRPFPTH